MKQSLQRIAGQAALFLAYSSAVTAQTPTVPLGAVTTLSCYKSVSPLVKDKDWPFMTDGWCQDECGGMGHPVMAIVGGSTCYCGDVIPSLDKVVDGKNCNSPCQGFGEKTCGGIGYYQVYLTGMGADVQTATNGTDTADPEAASSSSPAVVTKPGETVVVTQSPSSNASGGPNKVGIAVGVVVGLVIFASAVGAAIFFLKQRKKRAIEEEHRRNAAIAEFTSAKKSEGSSMTDSRLDPSFLSSHRRESIGSIADEMDFTRRILQVRNPDHRASNASNFA